MSFIPTIFVLISSLLRPRIKQLTVAIFGWREGNCSLIVLWIFYNEYVLLLNLKCHNDKRWHGFCIRLKKGDTFYVFNFIKEWILYTFGASPETDVRLRTLAVYMCKLPCNTHDFYKVTGLCAIRLPSLPSLHPQLTLRVPGQNWSSKQWPVFFLVSYSP